MRIAVVGTGYVRLVSRVCFSEFGVWVITRRPLPVDDPTQRCPDITQAAAVLGWQPTTPLKTGLARTIEYFDRLLAGRQPEPAARQERL